MHYEGGISLGCVNDLVEIYTGKRPCAIRLYAQPDTYSCGGSSVGVELCDVCHHGFTFRVESDCMATVTWEYDA